MIHGPEYIDKCLRCGEDFANLLNGSHICDECSMRRARQPYFKKEEMIPPIPTMVADWIDTAWRKLKDNFRKPGI